MSKLLCLLLLMLPQLLFAEWKYGQSGSPMDDNVVHFAALENVQPYRPIRGIYSDLQANLAFICSKELSMVSLSFNTPINATNSETQNGFNRVRGRVRWGDDDATSFVGDQTWGSSTLRFTDAMRPRLETYDKVLFEIPWHSAGNVIFEFDLQGAAEKVQQAVQACE